MSPRTATEIARPQLPRKRASESAPRSLETPGRIHGESSHRPRARRAHRWMATHDGRMILAVVSPWPVNQPVHGGQYLAAFGEAPRTGGCIGLAEISDLVRRLPVGQGRTESAHNGRACGSVPCRHPRPESRMPDWSLLAMVLVCGKCCKPPCVPCTGPTRLANAGALCRVPGRAAAIRLRELPD